MEVKFCYCFEGARTAVSLSSSQSSHSYLIISQILKLKDDEFGFLKEFAGRRGI